MKMNTIAGPSLAFFGADDIDALLTRFSNVQERLLCTGQHFNIIFGEEGKREQFVEIARFGPAHCTSTVALHDTCCSVLGFSDLPASPSGKVDGEIAPSIVDVFQGASG